jgi:peptidoglycan/LPS O-acetylase OafA/YrhL
VLLPAMIFAARSWYGSAALAVLAIGCLYLPPQFLAFTTQERWLAWRWGPLPYAMCFAAGVLAFSHRNLILRILGNGKALLVPTSLVLILVCQPSAMAHAIPFYTLVAAAFILGGEGRLGRLLLSNRPIFAVGEYSYSLYLVHYPIIVAVTSFASGWTALLASMALSAVATFVLYQFVEVPFRRLNDRTKRPIIA